MGMRFTATACGIVGGISVSGRQRPDYGDFVFSLSPGHVRSRFPTADHFSNRSPHRCRQLISFVFNAALLGATVNIARCAM